MSYEPIERQKLYELIADQLLRRISERQLRPGDPLPTERELTQAFRAGRSSVREALRMLESKGVIENRGNGTFVVAGYANPLNTRVQLLLSLDQATMLDVYELRRILECEAAGLAAERHGTRTSRLMDAAIDEMAAALASDDEDRGERYIDADLRFHLAIAEATRNGVVAAHDGRAARSDPARADVDLPRPRTAPSARSSSIGRSATRSPRATPTRARERDARASRPRRVRRPHALTLSPARGEATMAEVGYVGLGVMGGGVAKPPARRRPRRHGLEPHAREGAAADRRRHALGATRRARSPSGARSSSRWSRTPRRCRRSPRGRTGSSPASRPGRSTSTCRRRAPTNSRELAARVAELGAHMLDAPVSGSVITLEQGKLSVMVGGDEDVVRARRADSRGDRPEGDPRRPERLGGDDQDRDQPPASPCRCSPSARACCSRRRAASRARRRSR